MTSARHTAPARILHWLIAALLIVQIGLGLGADGAPRARAEALGNLHAQLGVVLLALILVRIGWRIAAPPPPLPASLGAWQRRGAAGVHRALCALLFAMPVSGLVVWMWIGGPLVLMGLVPLPLPRLAGEDEFWLSVAGHAHEWGAWALIGLAAGHIAAALWHQLVRRDRLISQRML